jgi:probable HAF family extracellular repeat protein
VPWLLALWAAGVALVLLRDGMAALRLRRRLGRLVPDGDGIVVSAQVASPLVVGLWRPVIVLPVGLGGEERELALLHERAHLRRGDLWLGLVFSAARALFWFLPFAHLAMREGEAAREEACDRLVREMGARPAAYGRLLLRLSTQTPPGGLGMAAIEHRALRRRLLALSEAPSRVSRLALALVGLFGVALLLPWKLTACAVARPVRPGVPAPRFAIETLSVEALGENYSDAFGINDAGQVVGAASDAQGRGRAFLHDAATGRGRAQPASTTKVRSSSSPTTERSARAAWSSHRTIREWGRAACAGYVASPTRSRTA